MGKDTGRGVLRLNAMTMTFMTLSTERTRASHHCRQHQYAREPSRPGLGARACPRKITTRGGGEGEREGGESRWKARVEGRGWRDGHTHRTDKWKGHLLGGGEEGVGDGTGNIGTRLATRKHLDVKVRLNFCRRAVHSSIIRVSSKPIINM